MMGPVFLFAIFPSLEQVCIRVIEIRQLQGLNVNPMVLIQIGNDQRRTTVQESTNCPYFDEVSVWVA